MCGVAGYIGHQPRPPHRLDACRALMHHRGPDHAGMVAVTLPDGAVAQVLHARLAIIDRDPRANQPFHDPRGVLAANAEFYNYRELRDELRASGEVFTTRGDTEIAARLLGRTGAAALSRLEGMFALVWVDVSGRVLLARDRFGEKPLFIAHADNGVYFGSEIAYLSALRGRGWPTDQSMITRFLVHGYKDTCTDDSTFFTGVSRLAPGTFLGRDPDGTWRSGGYAHHPCYRPDLRMSRADAVAQVREALIGAVDLRLRADVPVAVCRRPDALGGPESSATSTVPGHDRAQRER